MADTTDIDQARDSGKMTSYGKALLFKLTFGGAA